ncbi:MAG: 5-oxoprolinase subunit PxpB [Bacteroidota bacterium]
MKAPPIFRMFGERTLLLDWPSGIDPVIHTEVLEISDHVQHKYREQVVDIVPTYYSLAIYLREGMEVAAFVRQLKQDLTTRSTSTSGEKYVLTVPVCYDLEFGWDLEEVARFHGLSTSEVIAIHSATLYRTFFLGFLPGFPYLGGLDERLHTPRKGVPRPLISKGAVGIGGAQTGVYTQASPGGWQIIGQTPLTFFQTQEEPYTLINPGDFVKFNPVSKAQYELIKLEIASGTFSVDKEVYHD